MCNNITRPVVLTDRAWTLIGLGSFAVPFLAAVWFVGNVSL